MSETTMHDCYAECNGIRLHYHDFPGEQPLFLLHGLTANAASFGPIAAALGPQFRRIVPDLRGRGLSDKPASGYTMADHAADVVALADQLGFTQFLVGGHSFGGMMSIYLAAHYPTRINKVILMDAGLLYPNVVDLIKPSTDRIGKRWPSWSAYLEQIKSAPYIDAWELAMEAYFQADVIALEDGSITTRTAPEHLAQMIAAYSSTPWLEILPKVTQPALLINAPGGYGVPGTPAVQPPDRAEATARLMQQCTVATVPGNHLTMLFSTGAASVAEAIRNFVAQPS